MGNSKFNVSDASRLFSPCFLRVRNMFRGIEGKIIYKLSEGKQKLLWVFRRFESSKVWVTKAKITVNVWQKSRGNWFWFKLARLWVIARQLFLKVLNTWPTQLFKRWIQRINYYLMDKWISVSETNCVIQSIVIYPVDNTIHHLRNWVLTFILGELII